ncbi:hypothetical protein ACWE42_02965 [Sutcliffiella cohnii]
MFTTSRNSNLWTTAIGIGLGVALIAINNNRNKQAPTEENLDSSTESENRILNNDEISSIMNENFHSLAEAADGVTSSLKH